MERQTEIEFTIKLERQTEIKNTLERQKKEKINLKNRFE